MSGQASGSNASVPTTPKAIASLAKRQADVTRQGTQKLKFVPTLPARRKKDAEVKPDNVVLPTGSDRGRGHGRGRGGDTRGRGTGVSSHPAVAMTASGPFAMGPAMAGTSARRSIPKSNFAPIVPIVPGSSSAIGAGLSHPVKKEQGAEQSTSLVAKKDDDVDAYSDPDEGVEIIDMENICQMDWMAPESLRKEKHLVGGQKILRKGANTAKSADPKGKGNGDVDISNALNLSDSDSEEELEDLFEDFSFQAESQEGVGVRQERLYFFQFPSSFPTFSRPASFPVDTAMEVVREQPETSAKRVSFAPDTAPAAPLATSAAPEVVPKDERKLTDPKLDGVIGQLEIYRGGAIKMRLGNGILLDITAATQPSFLQHAVHVDMPNKRLSVLGEVNKRFVASPDIDALLSAMELADQAATAVKLGIEGEEIVIDADAS